MCYSSVSPAGLGPSLATRVGTPAARPSSSTSFVLRLGKHRAGQHWLSQRTHPLQLSTNPKLYSPQGFPGKHRDRGIACAESGHT